MKREELRTPCYVIMESENEKESADFTGNPTAERM